MSTFTRFFILITCGHSSVLLCKQCNTSCTCSFVDGVVFSHNGANAAESKTTHMLHPVSRWRHQGRWAKSAVPDCIFLNSVIYLNVIFLSISQTFHVALDSAKPHDEIELRPCTFDVHKGGSVKGRQTWTLGRPEYQRIIVNILMLFRDV